jgi:hypothetical protein
MWDFQRTASTFSRSFLPGIRSWAAAVNRKAPVMGLVPARSTAQTNDKGLAAAGSLLALQTFLVDRAIRSIRPPQYASTDVEGHRL